MVGIILDTCFLLVPYQLKIDIISELKRLCDFSYELCVIEQTLGELKNIIEKQSGMNKEAASFALELVKKEKVQIIPVKTESYKNVDELIVNLTDKENYIVATSDRELQSRLKEKSVRVIGVRQKRYLKFI